MSSKRVVVATFALLCVLGFAAAPIFAQATNSGTIIGQVTDPSGAAVAGAAVTITDLSTNTPRTTTTNAEGRYTFVNVPPGSYDVAISQKGFRTSKLSKQTVQVGTQLTLNVTLQVGAATEVIEVTATNTELQTINATVGNTVTGIAIDSLPAIGRDVTTFVTLQPGVAPGGQTAGVQSDQSTFQLDGGQNSNDMDGSMNVYTPSFANDPSGINGGGGPTGVMPTPIDSVEEFKSNTTGQTADFNSSAGSQVSLVTRRGTDSWHGTVYEYYLDNNWDADTWDNNAANKPIPSYHYSRFGAAAGGPLIPKKVLGGKTYFFANYQGFRWPNSRPQERAVPGPGMREGLLSFGGTVYNLNPSATTYTGPTITGSGLVNGMVYPSATTQAACGGVSCDPRNLGISPVVAAVWNALPQSNETTCSLSRCDGVNVLGFRSNTAIPQDDNFGVVRMDHDFSDKWHFFSSFRYYHLTRATTDQTDITAAGITSLSNRPQVPWFLVTGLTTNITNNLTNDFHYSYLRNWWQWGTEGGAAQGSAAAPGGVNTCAPAAACVGLGAAIEPFGESATQALIPYNVNAQQARTRYWDGKDNMIRDDMSYLRGNHLFQWGGTYQHNFNQHQRTDNGSGINYYPTYQLGTTTGAGAGVSLASAVPTGLVGSTTNYSRDYAAVMGIVSQAQRAFTRSGTSLTLNTANGGLVPAMDQSVIPFYNVYFTDTWKLTPTFTLNYGLAWTLEMPPVEQNGLQVELVDQANQVINTQAYLNTRKQEALKGEAYNPQLGFTLVGNSEGGRKYPYNPYYGSFSPRLGMAWNPNYDSGLLGSIFGHGKTVVRGGFSILYGRLNGVDLVLVPLLGTGLIQAVTCTPAGMAGTCGAPVTAANAFRLGPMTSGWDGLAAPLPAPSPTLPQPDFPGINAVSAGPGAVLDSNFRPSKSYTMDFTVQRQITPRISVEAGYIGRILRNEYQGININAVPYMITAGGQSFAKAYAAADLAYCGGVAGLAGGGCNNSAANVTAASSTAQPFFETALGGATSAYCAPFAAAFPTSPCTAAVVQNEGSVKTAIMPNGGTGNLDIQNVWSLFSDLDKAGFTFGRTMLNTPIPGSPFGASGQLTSGIAENASIGYGNYNALFFTLKSSDWHGLTAQSNFTWGKALGTGANVQSTSSFTVPDPYWLGRGYTEQPWDRQFLFNTYFVYAPPVYKAQHGVIGHLLGGWSFSPIFVSGSGQSIDFANTSNLTVNGSGQSFGEADANSFATFENLVPIGPYNTGSASRHTCTNPATKQLYPCSGPTSGANNFRDPILGFDTGRNAAVLRGLPFWNLDFAVVKNTHITERVSFEFHAMFANFLNHMQASDQSIDLSNTGQWGALNENVLGNGQVQNNTPRNIEFGFRVRF
jgi:hypothetical protein